MTVLKSWSRKLVNSPFKGFEAFNFEQEIHLLSVSGWDTKAQTYHLSVFDLLQFLKEIAINIYFSVNTKWYLIASHSKKWSAHIYPYGKRGGCDTNKNCVSSFKLQLDCGFSKSADFLCKLIFRCLLLLSFKFYQLPARKLMIKHQNCF